MLYCAVYRGFAVEVASRLVSADWLWSTNDTGTNTNNSTDGSDSSSGEADGATLFEVIVAR